MKFEWNRRDSTVAAYTFVVLALSILFYHFISHFSAVRSWSYQLIRPVFPIFYGFAIAYLLDPVMGWIETLFKRFSFYSTLPAKRQRGLSLFLTYLLTLAVLTVFALIVLPQVYYSISTMASQIQSYVASAERLVSEVLERIPQGLIPQVYIDQVTGIAGETVSNLISLVGSSVPLVLGWAVNIGSGVISAIMGIIVSGYLLFSKEKFLAQLRKALCAFLPKSRANQLFTLGRTTDHMFGRFITGKIVDSIIIGLLCFLGLTVLRMPNTVLVSFIVGVTNVIPYFGPFLGAIPSFFLIAFISPAQAFVFLLFVLVLQQLDGNVIGPMILGDSTGLSAFWIIFAILFFGGAFGIFGMFIGVPTFGVIYWIIKEKILVLLTRKGLPLDTGAYLRSVIPNPPKAGESEEKQ